MKYLYIFFIPLILFAGCSKYGSGRLVFVTNERAGSITVIDGDTDKVIDTILTGARPRGIRVSTNGKQAYVAISSPMNAVPRQAENYIAVLDTSSGALIRKLDVGMDPEQI